MSADVTYDRAPGHVHAYLRHTIMRCEVGSTVYGTGLPGRSDLNRRSETLDVTVRK